MAKYLPPLIAGRTYLGFIGLYMDGSPEAVTNAVVPHVEVFASKAAAVRGGYDIIRRVTITIDETTDAKEK